MISKSIQLMSICSTVNRELQGIHIGGVPALETMASEAASLGLELN